VVGTVGNQLTANTEAPEQSGISSALYKGAKWTAGGMGAMYGTGLAVTKGTVLVQNAVSWYFGGGIFANIAGTVLAGASTSYLTAAGAAIGGVAGVGVVVLGAKVLPRAIEGASSLASKCNEIGTGMLTIPHLY
jgi:hypothetical protein